MNHSFRTAALAALATGLAAASAQAQTGMSQQLFSNTLTAPTGFVGYHLIGPTSDPNRLPFGIGLDLGTTSSFTPQYLLALERGEIQVLGSFHAVIAK